VSPPGVSRSESISPTAHYTGYVWARNGLSHPELATTEGRLLFEALRPVIAAGRALGGASLENYLLARHRAIDALLERTIDDEGITQVLEVACGLSPRGWRFSERYGDRITYVEADLPDMAARKRRALERMGSLGERHRVVALDALEDTGPRSLASVTDKLDPGQGLAIITEGLLSYLSTETVEEIWRRFARTLQGFARGRYISDVHLAGLQSPQVRIFRVILSAFVRGRVYLHFASAHDGEAALLRAGFDAATVRRAAELAPEELGRGSELAHILEASTSPLRPAR
jgi:O-methyltransferase involved in polyketide biosynthesis